MVNTSNPFELDENGNPIVSGPFTGPGGAAPTSAPAPTGPIPNGPGTAGPRAAGPGVSAPGMPFGAPDFMKGKKFTAEDAAAASANVPLGRHLAAIRKVDSSRVSNNGNPMIVFSLEVLDGPALGKETDYFYTLTDKTTWLIPELGTAMGIPGPWGLEDFEASVGTVVVIEVKQGREFQGRAQTQVDRFWSPQEMGIAAGTRHAKGSPLVR